MGHMIVTGKVTLGIESGVCQLLELISYETVFFLKSILLIYVYSEGKGGRERERETST